MACRPCLSTLAARLYIRFAYNSLLKLDKSGKKRRSAHLDHGKQIKENRSKLEEKDCLWPHGPSAIYNLPAATGTSWEPAESIVIGFSTLPTPSGLARECLRLCLACWTRPNAFARPLSLQDTQLFGLPDALFMVEDGVNANLQRWWVLNSKSLGVSRPSISDVGSPV